MLGFLMGSATGIIITISFLEMMSEASKIYGLPVAAGSFVDGSLLMFVSDLLFSK